MNCTRQSRRQPRRQEATDSVDYKHLTRSKLALDQAKQVCRVCFLPLFLHYTLVDARFVVGCWMRAGGLLNCEARDAAAVW